MLKIMVLWDVPSNVVDMYFYFRKKMWSQVSDCSYNLNMEAADSVASASCNVCSKVSHRHH